MHRTTNITAAALAAAAGFTALTAGPAAADTPAPSPTTLPTWTVVHPTYQQHAVTLPAPAPSPTTPARTAAAAVVSPPAQTRRPQATTPPRSRITDHRRAPRRVVHRHRQTSHHAPTMRVGHTTYRAGSGKWLVVHGETLSYIAGIFDVTVDQLARANGITDPDRVYADTWLTIPAGAR